MSTSIQKIHHKINLLKEISGDTRFNTLVSMCKKYVVEGVFPDLKEPALSATAYMNAHIFYVDSIYDMYRCLTALHFLELALRNKIHEAFKEQWGDDWITTHPKVQTFRQTKKYVEKARHYLMKANKPANGDNMVHEIPFGFWIRLMEKDMYKLWRPTYYTVFHTATQEQGFNRFRPDLVKIRETLVELEKLRNRIAHIQPHYPCYENVFIKIRFVLRELNPNYSQRHNL